MQLLCDECLKLNCLDEVQNWREGGGILWIVQPRCTDITRIYNYKPRTKQSDLNKASFIWKNWQNNLSNFGSEISVSKGKGWGGGKVAVQDGVKANICKNVWHVLICTFLTSCMKSWFRTSLKRLEDFHRLVCHIIKNI